ncbi:maleylpyruvate isomerase N-terminal domain-containing protein [Streptomyces sp. NPDC046860]|uniref:maleylpyruvate isomerase N-terminal domain-containing protein n=1 Tax=Streptomyces sp. NPDC046860 TaxID=3154495 RepID=UPI0033F8B3FF
MNGPDRSGAPGGPEDETAERAPARRGPAGEAARVPAPRSPAGAERLDLPHEVLRSLLGAWALAACSAAETEAVEEHLGECGACADEARRLREAVGLLHRPESLEVDPTLRNRVLENCLRRRPPRIPVPDWAASYDAETARLDALLRDFGDAEWHTPVRLRWFEAGVPATRRTTVAGVIAHLLSVDGMVATALGLEDPLTETAAGAGPGPGAAGPAERTEAFWRASHFPQTRAVRGRWRDQSHRLLRTVSFTGGAGGLPVGYGDFTLPLRDAMVDRAFECWVHAEDIANAVHYPYDPPAPRHLSSMIELAARMLPLAVAAHRGAAPARTPARSLRLEIEGAAGGQWLIPLDSPAGPVPEHEVAHVALDGVEFCRLAAGHLTPEETTAGQRGDREAIRDVLTATASLSRM